MSKKTPKIVVAPVTRQLTKEEREHDRLMTTRDLAAKFSHFKSRVGKSSKKYRYVNANRHQR